MPKMDKKAASFVASADAVVSAKTTAKHEAAALAVFIDNAVSVEREAVFLTSVADNKFFTSTFSICWLAIAIIVLQCIVTNQPITLKIYVLLPFV
jgi:hypothetical protein